MVGLVQIPPILDTPLWRFGGSFRGAVADALSVSGLAYDVAPFLHGHLTGDHHGSFRRTLLDRVTMDPTLISIMQVSHDQKHDFRKLVIGALSLDRPPAYWSLTQYANDFNEPNGIAFRKSDPDENKQRSSYMPE